MREAAAEAHDRHPHHADLHRQVERLKNVPTLPKLLERVIAALEDPEVDLHHVAELIEVDPSLTAQVLRLANSAFHGVQGKVSQVGRALVILGAVVTRSLALSTGSFNLRATGLRGFWEHSIGCAVASGAVAKVTGLAQTEEVTAAGLLHDLGKVVLVKEIPSAFTLIHERAVAENRPFRDLEREVLGVDHGEIAAWLVERWRFPACLAEPIILHHHPGRARVAMNETAIVHVGNTLVRALGFGHGGDTRIPAIDPAAWARLDLTSAKLDRILDVFETDLDHALNFAIFD